MNGFIGRKEELKILNRALREKKSAFIPIYGRRRVGKTELIFHFIKGKKALYYCGKKARAQMQIKEFLRGAATALKEPLLAEIAPENWKHALSLVTEKCSSSRKCILALDEFQWIADASPDLPSTLQELWDRSWKKRGNIMIILCGSYMGFMEREVLGKNSPLFGRRTSRIHLKPFGYLEATRFHPSYSLEDRVKTYFICGGIPLYLEYFSPEKSVEMNIIDNLLSQYAPLFQEPDFLLREELRELENYYAILLAIAQGTTAHTDISQKTTIDNRALHYYLKQLIDLGYLSRRYPLFRKKSSPRDVRYILDDPLLRFWFRFIYPNTSYIIQFGGEKALAKRIALELDSYFGYCFERLCREALGFLYHKEGVKAGFEIGEYWDKNTQIDVVGFREDNWTDLGECKWGGVRSPKKLEKELQHKIGFYPNLRNATISRRIFTKKPFPKRIKGGRDIRRHCLRDLFPIK